ncbi:MAG: hypothetical protein Q7U12_03235 [Undibacterium sp.]|nr:hypothetical protein [Undibacterium sp.]
MKEQEELAMLEDARFNAQQNLQASLQLQQEKEKELTEKLAQRLCEEEKASALLQQRIDEETEALLIAASTATQEEHALNDAQVLCQQHQERSLQAREKAEAARQKLQQEHAQAEVLTTELISKLTQNYAQNQTWCGLALQMLKESPVSVDIPVLSKSKTGSRLRSSAMLGLFICAGFAGAASWTSLNSSGKTQAFHVSKNSMSPVISTKEHEMKLHMSYELGGVSETSTGASTKTVTQIALNDVKPGK